MIRQHELQTEFSKTNGNAKAWGYFGRSGPDYSERYVEWLEDLATALKQELIDYGIREPNGGKKLFAPREVYGP